MGAKMNNPWNSERPWDVENIWVKSEPIMNSMTEKRTGDPGEPWRDYICRKFMWPALSNWTARVKPEQKAHAHRFVTSKPTDRYRCLVLGSTEAAVEKALWDWGFTGEIIVSEVADKALSRTKALAESTGHDNTRFLLADLNTHRFDGNFDYIIANGVLHHIQNIEWCIEGLATCLAPNGLIIASEYTGPFRFQMPRTQVEWINAVLALAPACVRLNSKNDVDVGPCSPAEHWARPYTPPTENQMMGIDPTEAVGGYILDDLFRRHFEIVQYSQLGGTLTTYLHDHIDYRKTNDGPGRAWMEAVIALEERLIASGTLNCDFTFYVGEAKKSAREGSCLIGR